MRRGLGVRLARVKRLLNDFALHARDDVEIGSWAARSGPCCLLGLLAVTGLDVSEALGLQYQDVDLEQGWLTTRGAKFGKSRLIPLHQPRRDELVICAEILSAVPFSDGKNSASPTLSSIAMEILLRGTGPANTLSHVFLHCLRSWGVP
jgi:integrase